MQRQTKGPCFSHRCSLPCLSYEARHITVNTPPPRIFHEGKNFKHLKREIIKPYAFISKRRL